jgi:gamma-glutamylaminecyclotransferase
MTKVFVYGTLKKDFHNNCILDNDEYVGIAYSKRKLVLVEQGGLPFVLDPNQFPIGDKDLCCHIFGELYNITDANTLYHLDRLENHPDWYERRETEFIDKKGVTHKAWCYFLNDELTGKCHVNISGDYQRSI